MMLDIYDYPDEIHKIMGMLRDYNLYKIDFAEKNGLLTLNNDELYGSGGVFGYTRELPAWGFDGHHVRPMDMWGWFESQETVGVSPALFEEFVFRYQLPVMEKFGLISYGCRVEIVMKDNHTIGKNTQNVLTWSRIAKEEAQGCQ